VKIKRTTANKIMGQASKQPDNCLLGILDSNERLINAFTLDEITQLLSDHSDSVLFFNQSTQASDIKDRIVYSDGQQHIEVFQDTEGVFGLRAYLQKGKIQTPITLELSG
jgi:hypothetical protein